MSKLLLALGAMIILTMAHTSIAYAQEVNLYSARKENLIKPLLDQFTQQTSIKVNLVTGKADALLKRLETEGKNTPADILITTDAGRLHRAKTAGLLQPLKSPVLEQAVPEHLRDPEGAWYGLSTRSRVIVYAKDRVNPSELSTYEDLADAKWKRRVCVRSSDNIYNQSLLASMIASRGPAEAEAWARGLVANLARPPQGNDRAQVKAVAAGVCDLALVNTYYLGTMLNDTKDPSQQRAAEQVGIFFPNQNDRGAHVNVSGAALTKYAKHRDQAVKLLEFLLSDPAQAWYAQSNHEYPVKPGVAISDTVKSWGYPFKSDSLNLSQLGIHNAAAVMVFDRAGWR